MIETRLEIPTIATETLLFRPDDIGAFPGVVFLTDIWGIRPATIAMAKRLAEKGFAVLMPNVFHRYSRITPDGFEPEDADKKMKTHLPANAMGQKGTFRCLDFRGTAMGRDCPIDGGCF